MKTPDIYRALSVCHSVFWTHQLLSSQPMKWVLLMSIFYRQGDGRAQRNKEPTEGNTAEKQGCQGTAFPRRPNTPRKPVLKFMKWSFSCTLIAKENNWLVNARRPHGTIKPVNTAEPKSLLQGTNL